ncbi:MAG: glycerol-3-phosphate dehydrogenase/oxidase [Saprospiraceae bacterium]|nr:glycerol-3-phosphate dehydrogenase/oxidase [Saprospiraceae bacterium]
MTLSQVQRPQFIQQLQSKTFDLLVVGGGITGAGIALDAASRGLTVALVEKGDFASGTSGKSTKLIHGGLRYLKQFEFGLVKEVGQERAILHRLAPHLVVPEKMVLPLIEDGSLGKTMTSIGLFIYDYLAEVQGDDKRRMLDPSEIKAIEPLLPEDKLLGGSLYAEYRTDDARLTIEVIKTAFRHGAVPLNYTECVEFIEENGKIFGALCRDHLTDTSFRIVADQVVNATGPWVDDLRSLDGPITGKHLYLTKGVHVVVNREKLPVRHALYFDVPMDKRMIFAIPRLDVTYIGTTDTYYEGDKDHVKITRAEVDYLLNAVNQTFASCSLDRTDVEASWAGVRPLIYEDGKSASEISRKDEIFVSDKGLISIAGGKLTGYRKMAERVVDLVVKAGKDLRKLPCQTEQIPLTDPHFVDQSEVDTFVNKLKAQLTAMGLRETYAPYLAQNYGLASQSILEDSLTGSRFQDPEGALVWAELTYCMDNEMMGYPSDFVVRRTGRLYFMPQSLSVVRQVVFAYFREELKWSSHQISIEENKWLEMLSIKSDFS